jgi:uncharacterized SAM-binding protein YcdF (DUF218 family)
MLYVIGKVFWAIVAPGNLLLLFLLFGLAALVHRRRPRGSGASLAILAALGLLTLAILPVGQWALAPLEARFPVPHLPAHVDGIIVLGGAVEPAIARAHGEVALNDAAERIVEPLVLLRQHPEARLLLSGGDAALLPRGDGLEADVTQLLFVALGIAPERILVEDRSRNTVENALYSRNLAQPKPGEVWVLVTSAAHMPRAVGCFRRIGWDVLAYPVDFRTEARPRPGFDLGGHLAQLDWAAKEWVGLLAYRLLDRTDAWFPAPAVSASNS